MGLLNVRSLNTGQEELIACVQRFEPDILALNEIWLKSAESKCAPKIPGYTLKYISRKSGTGGGVGFYIGKHIKYKIGSHPQSNLEQMWLEVLFPGYRMAIGTVYRSEKVIKVESAIDDLDDSINCFAYCDCVCVLTDFNVDFLNPNKSHLLTEYIDNRNLKQLVEVPTRITDKSSTLLDIIITDTPQIFKNTQVHHNPNLSDHAMILVDCLIRKPKVEPKIVYTRSLKNINLSLFEYDLNTINWQNLLQQKCVNYLTDNLTNILSNLFDRHAPVKRTQIKETSRPWLTDNVKFMMSLRDKAFKKAQATKLDIHIRYYKDLRNLVNSTIKREKVAYFTHFVNRNSKNSKELWTHLKRTTVLDDPCATELPESFNNPNAINNYFLNLPNNSSDYSTIYMNTFKNNKLNNSQFHLKTTNETEVIKIINNIKTNARGHDDISIDMLKLTLPKSLAVITHLINLSIESQIFPNKWKHALVIPLPKQESVQSYKDLRPISILPILSKILERIVQTQLSKYFKEYNILPQIQSGFRKYHSTATTLAHVTDDILTQSDRGNSSALILLDFSKAFDSINTELLLQKLSYYGVSSASCCWFKSFLSNRCQQVTVNLHNGTRLLSDIKSIERGIPQGSILSPLLFILYTTDLPTVLKHCKIHMYADDTQLYHSFKPELINDAFIAINADLAAVHRWSNDNGLVLNPTKSQFMILGTKKQRSVMTDVQISINGNYLKRVDEAKNLGLNLDSEIRFKNYIQKKVSYAFYKLKILYRIRNYLTQDTRILLTDSIVLSNFNYCDVIYGPRLLAKTQKEIQRIQNACARFCFKIPKFSHVSPFINEKNILNMLSRRSLHMVCLVHKIVHSKQPIYLAEKLIWWKDAHNYKHGTRSHLLTTLDIPPYRTTGFRGSFKYAASKIWNNLPPPVRNISVFSGFKKRARLWFMEKQR